MLMNFIRKIVGALSRPKVLFQSSCGDYWVESHTVFDDRYWEGLKYYWQLPDGSKISEYYREQYTQVKQNFWGYWEVQTTYLGKHFPLPKVIN